MGENLSLMSYKLFVLKEALPYSIDYLKATKTKYEVLDSENLIPHDGQNKNIIYKVNRGRFLTACPGTPRYVCCGYFVLSPVENCPFSCTYCILNAYFNTQDITVYVNTDDMIKELQNIRGKAIKRIGTGEFSDSLAIPETRLYLNPVLDFFKKNRHIFLELKTKSAFIPDDFFKDHYENVIFSWSLNSTKIRNDEEQDTATIGERISAAEKIVRAGYRVSFHFDPIIHYEGWEQDYKETIEQIFAHLPEKSIVWISLGTLRFIPHLKDIATNLYPSTNIFHDEFITGQDGKKRYFRKRRVEIYKKMVNMIREFLHNVFIYLCMENDDVWKEVFDMDMNSQKLKELMDERL